MKRLRAPRLKTREDGFSLIDVVVTVAIIVALSVGGFVSYTGLTDQAKQAAVSSAADRVLTAIGVADNDSNPLTNYDSVKADFEKTTDAIRISITGSGDTLRVVAANISDPRIKAVRGANPSAEGAVVLARTNLFANPEVKSLDGFAAVTGQTQLSYVDGAARFTLESTSAAGVSIPGAQAARGTESRILIRARANRPLELAVRQRGDASPIQTMGTEWQWYEQTINPGTAPINQTGFILANNAGHQKGDWVEIDRVLFSKTPDSGEFFSGNKAGETLGGRAYTYRWLGTPNNSASVAEYRAD